MESKPKDNIINSSSQVEVKNEQVEVKNEQVEVKKEQIEQQNEAKFKEFLRKLEKAAIEDGGVESEIINQISEWKMELDEKH